MHPPACARYWPRFGSPCACAATAPKASATLASTIHKRLSLRCLRPKNKPRRSGVSVACSARCTLLPFPECVVTRVAALVDREDLRADAVLVTAFAHKLGQLCGLGHELVLRFLELRSI